MAKVKYIGRKPTAVDNVANSGKFWSGFGDVQEVNDRQARTLLTYPDQWVLDDESDSLAVHKEPVTRFINPEGDRVEIPESALKKPLEHMGKDELRAYALERFQKSLHPNMGRKRMVDEIEEMERGMEPFTGK
jgi:hypothetical protein